MLPVNRFTLARRKFCRLVKRNSPPKREYEKPSKWYRCTSPPSFTVWLLELSVSVSDTWKSVWR